TVRHHDDDSRFCQTTTDVEWITALASDKMNWVVVSGDGRILKNKAEKAALLEAKLKFFCLSKQWMSTPFAEMAWKFLKVWPDIVEHATYSRNQLFEISAGQALKVTPI